MIKTFWVGIVKNGCGQSGHGTLKLMSELLELSDFLYAGVNLGKLNGVSIIVGWVWSKMAMAI